MLKETAGGYKSDYSVERSYVRQQRRKCRAPYGFDLALRDYVAEDIELLGVWASGEAARLITAAPRHMLPRFTFHLSGGALTLAALGT